ncbi:urease accessory UreF family protein [Psychrobacter sp.]|uniref:urease accessory protein UreF n=1 Tax=Psychrobacter sp. TaxID=56811 RepID=UPI0025D41179|nr:urease accessory UreF family protein [Psychrobacter sp.]
MTQLKDIDVTGRLLMLASSNLPIGSYTYSQGIEPAIEAALIHDEDSTLQFMQDYLELALIGYELPLLALMIKALTSDNEKLAQALGADYHANRESKEFVYESSQLAISLSAWLDEVLDLNVPDELLEHGFLPLFANICAHWQVKPEQAITTYAFGQIENMVLAAVKTVPLGQMAGQRIIWQLQQQLSHQSYQVADNVNQAYEQCFNQSKGIEVQLDIHSHSSLHSEDLNHTIAELYQHLNMSANLPNLAMLSCQHERQYSRLFRS